MSNFRDLKFDSAHNRADWNNGHGTIFEIFTSYSGITLGNYTSIAAPDYTLTIMGPMMKYEYYRLIRGLVVEIYQ